MPDIALRIRGNFANTRPELVKDMDDTLVALLPEIARAAPRWSSAPPARWPGCSPRPNCGDADLLQLRDRQEIRQRPAAAARFIFEAMEPWMQQTSDFFLTRFREETRKKGHTL